MSFISCPQCGKRTSSLAPLCPHCGFKRGETSEEQELAERLRLARKRVYRLSIASYVIITCFVVAFAWYWWSTAGFQQPAERGPFILMGIAGVAYLVARGFLYYAKYQAKKAQIALKRSVK